jgi:hypothetical protein
VAYVVNKNGCRIEVTDAGVNVKIRFRGEVAIPLTSIKSVRLGIWRHITTLQIETPNGTYEWSVGDRTYEAANAIASAVGLPSVSGIR